MELLWKVTTKLGKVRSSELLEGSTEAGKSCTVQYSTADLVRGEPGHHPDPLANANERNSATRIIDVQGDCVRTRSQYSYYTERVYEYQNTSSYYDDVF